MKMGRASLAITAGSLVAVWGVATTQAQTNIFPSNGAAGIGTLNPAADLDINRPGGAGAYLLMRGAANQLYFGVPNTDTPFISSNSMLRFATAGYNRLAITSGGNIGIGTTDPGANVEIFRQTGGATLRLHNGDQGQSYSLTIGSDYWYPFIASDSVLRLMTADIDRIVILQDGRVGIGTPNPETLLDVQGTAQVNVLQITGGSDLAEPFGVAMPEGQDTRIVPGMVVVIDPEKPGELKLADEAYDRKVAGIISGANGLSPGMVMTAAGNPATRPATENRELRTENLAAGAAVAGMRTAGNSQPETGNWNRETGNPKPGVGNPPPETGNSQPETGNSQPETEYSSHPIALTGRVWCWCDAAYGAIAPGDRLTTSGTLGHAMKAADHGRAGGAVIGKAMSKLDDGKGLVLLLVQPQ